MNSFKEYVSAYVILKLFHLFYNTMKLPNQELSGAKSELQGETVGVCSFYKRGGQPPSNSALRSMQMFLFAHI